MITEQSRKVKPDFDGVIKKFKQNKALKQEVMSNRHGMLCGNCLKTTDITTLVREEYIKGLSFGTFPIYCEHCGSERTVTLDFSE
ncbi:hypothetical protein [Lactococcus protaetiae]|uniref:Uncharacterized protein n=1 Tax=Lactococcus protaetiae TaxID=2592653 RepID=A0A514Z6C9_9LACT|nr:hypothetical protein [Lactococcus protaetiae]QDK70161.1 hypothetical protein FLP15_01930 [Lactococcus protaetiae]